ncbi:MAG: polyprenyl diphosphate synthase [Anaerolineae bacterium]|nr:polyprenyl diphosphate synthase [Anaerolineae bacterium]
MTVANLVAPERVVPLDPNLPIPQHVGIIMDGNGRWARARGLSRLEGHRAGTRNIRRVLEEAVRIGIKVLTIYAFSTENWGRPRAEVSHLMRLISESIRNELDELDAQGVQIRHSGRMAGVSSYLQKQIRGAIERTRHNDRIILNVAFNYGGRAEIVDAIKHIIEDGVKPEEVDEALVSRYLYTAGLPDPDMIIRTGGEYRLSNFLIWQAAYAEYYATPTFWPDFDEAELRMAIAVYQSRDRRFGLVK